MKDKDSDSFVYWPVDSTCLEGKVQILRDEYLIRNPQVLVDLIHRKCLELEKELVSTVLTNHQTTGVK